MSGWRLDRGAGRGSVGVGLVVLGLVAGCGDGASTGAGGGAGYVGPAFEEPVTLASENGVLEVNLYARQGSAEIDTAAATVQNFLLFRYELLRGTASDGRRSGDDQYPGPTLRVNPGEKLILHVHNELVDLTIRDFFDPAFVSAEDEIPLYPRQLPSAPYNVHVHGLHVSPKGNSDNVLLSIPGGYTNTYSYDIPLDHPEGLYWYHSHRHQVTGQETYLGLCGILSIGRPDGNIPAVTDHELPIRTMALQYNYVFDRKGGSSLLNNFSWPQWVSTLVEPTGTQLADGTYEPKLTPTNFVLSDAGTKYLTVWYAGALSTTNNRGEFALMPGNLQDFAADSGNADDDLPADLTLPEHQRDLQYTINGQFQPTILAKPGQTEIWALANITDQAYFNLQLTETATGRHPPIAIVGVDGNPVLNVHNPIPPSDGTTLVIPPASRYAIAVTMPEEGELLLEQALATDQADATGPGILYTNDGTRNSPAVLGTITVPSSVISYYDGFFYYPTQVLARMVPESGQGVTVDFTEGVALNAYTSFYDTEGMDAAVTRTFDVSGGFDNELANENDPKAFVYEFQNNTFPYSPLIQPRLNSIEEWKFVNDNNDSHPIHVHVNDFQVSEKYSPLEDVTTGYQKWGQDNANLPVPVSDAEQNVSVESRLSLRSLFQEYTGTFVTHCHRLNHEDAGMMLIVNVIPESSTYAVAHAGAAGLPAIVRIYDGDGDALVGEVEPFVGHEGEITAVMGDIDGDQVLDLVVGAGPGWAPEVVVYSGASGDGFRAFGREIVRFLAFEEAFAGGVSVAAADIDGNPYADNIIVGSGPGIETSVKIYSPELPGLGVAPRVWSEFSPYEGSTAGIAVTSALFDAMAGRNDIVTVPGPGEPARVRSFRYDLYTPNESLDAWCAPDPELLAEAPRLTSDFVAFDESYTSGVSLGSGWIAGAEGGAQSLVAGQLAGSGIVRVFTSGSALFGQPADYLVSPDAHDDTITFDQVAEFAPFPDAPSGGVRVATTSDVHGANLLASGVDADGATTLVEKYEFVVDSSSTATLAPVFLAQVEADVGSRPATLGGD